MIYEDIFQDNLVGVNNEDKMDHNEDGDEKNDAEDETKQEQALRLLTETDWNKERSILIPIKDKLKSLLSL